LELSAIFVEMTLMILQSYLISKDPERYFGANPFRALKTKSRILKSIL